MNRIAPDKWKHFFIGIPLGAALLWVLLFILPVYPVQMLILAFIILLVICYGFELFSKVTGKGHYEMMDAIAGILGGMIGMAAVWFYYY